VAVVDRFDAAPVGAGQIFATVVPDWILENLPPELRDHYRLSDLFVADFQGVLYWVIRQVGNWQYGDLVGGWIYDAVRAGDVVADIEAAPVA
jgi:hypothetical protein